MVKTLAITPKLLAFTLWNPPQHINHLLCISDKINRLREDQIYLDKMFLSQVWSNNLWQMTLPSINVMTVDQKLANHKKWATWCKIQKWIKSTMMLGTFKIIHRLGTTLGPWVVSKIWLREKTIQLWSLIQLSTK